MHTDVRVLRVNTSELFYMVSKVILDCIGPRNFDLWLVQKPFLTNQMQNYSQSRPGGKRFPALDAGCEFQPCDLIMPFGISLYSDWLQWLWLQNTHKKAFSR